MLGELLSQRRLKWIVGKIGLGARGCAYSAHISGHGGV
jgi:hypothetical protein